MKHLLLTTIAAVLVVGCGESQQSAPAPKAKPVEPVAEVSKSEPPKGKAPDISIHKAALAGNIEAVKQAIADGADVNAKRFGLTPLHEAAKGQHSGPGGHTDIAELLIANGADVNATDDFLNGRTPLSVAARYGNKETAELLIAEGADVNAKANDGKTPLDYTTRENEPAAAVFGTGTEIADLLRKHGGKTGKELKAEGK